MPDGGALFPQGEQLRVRIRLLDLPAQGGELRRGLFAARRAVFGGSLAFPPLFFEIAHLVRERGDLLRRRQAGAVGALGVDLPAAPHQLLARAAQIPPLSVTLDLRLQFGKFGADALVVGVQLPQLALQADKLRALLFQRLVRVFGIAVQFALFFIEVGLCRVKPALEDGVEPFAVHFEVEQARDEAQALAAVRLDELRKFALRERDALFEIFKGKADDGADLFVGGFDAVADDVLRVAVQLGQRELLLRVLAADLALHAVNAAAAVLIDGKIENGVRPVAAVVDDLVPDAAAHAVHLAVQREDHAVEDGGLAAAGIPENAEDPARQKALKVDDRPFRKAVDAAKFQTFRPHTLPPPGKGRAASAPPPGPRKTARGRTR